ncbi:MAG: hypothetical protein IJP20_02270 [Clostridia bacterium]|nr:hypothetical protein [Clostridia bacterium]MBQ9978600.1 hypothetical protein [Clostridia bacterium]
MKKNTMMRVASALLVAVLLTTCAISGTFAKYVTSATATATATVAKWDIKLDGTDITTGTPNVDFNLAETWTDYDGSAEVDVDDKLLAPGTAGSFDFVITNSSEVNAKYSITLAETITGLPGTVAEADFPVEYSTDNAHWSNDIANAVASGTLAMNGGNATVTVYWRWAFNGNDTIDTALGVATPTVTITATINVEQVD